MISVLLADDHQVVLSGLKAMLAGETEFHVVGEATDGLQVVPLVERHKPDVLVLDLMMPGLNGLEVARQLEKKVPSTRVVILSMHANEAYVVEALRAGASGYVLKQSPGNELSQAIRAVMTGRRYLSPPLSDEVLRRFEERMTTTALDPYDTLSGREREVLQLAAEGLTNAEIAKKLDIGKRTVETHRANLIRKLDLKSHADLVKYAIRRGLITG
jgi:DNA-binding NarL/FixJ family response regulator